MGLFLALILLISISVLSFQDWNGLKKANIESQQTRLILETVQRLSLLLDNAESGQRGFLLTGDRAYLQPYTKSVPQIYESLRTLKAARTGGLARSVDQLESLTNEKLAELAETIRMRERGDAERALQIVRTDRGKILADAIGTVADGIVLTEIRRRDAITESLEMRRNRVGFLASVGSAVIAVVVLLSIFSIRRATERQSQLLNEIEGGRDMLETTLASIGDAVIVTDANGRVLFLNGVARALTGWKDEEGQGKPLRQIFPLLNEETGSVVENPTDRVLREGVVVGLANHTILLAKDGRKIPIDDSAAPIRRRSGQMEGVVLVFRDVTERRNAEQQLRDSERRYRAMFQSNPQPMWEFDLRTLKFLAVNDAAVEHYGYTRDEFLSMTVRDIRPAEDVEALLADLRNEKPGIDRAGHWRHKKKCGAVIDVNIIAHAGVGPEPTEFVLADDITERLRNEAAVRDSTERLNLALEVAGMGVWSWEVFTGRIYLDGRSLEIFGFQTGGFGGKFDDLKAVVHPDDRQIFVDLAEAAGEGEREVGLEFRVHWPDGSVHAVMSRGKGFYDVEGRLIRVTGLNQEVTQQKRAEEQARQSQKMEAIGRLAGGVAHDFNNLLTVIMGYANVLQGRLRNEDPNRKTALEIQRAAERAALLTGQLLAFSRKQITQTRAIDLNELIGDMTDMLQRLLGEDIDLKVVKDPRVTRVRADAGQIGQVLMNLVANARDAMPGGGKMVIETTLVERDSENAGRHGVRPAGRYAMLVVSDSGAGMDAETQAHIFEPFFTTKESGKGTGLGLATVYGIIQQHGGWIDVYSEPGQGTSLKVYLPEEANNEMETPAIAPSTRTKRRVTILLVEDQAPLRMLAEEVLEEAGHRVLSAGGSAAALAIAEKRIDQVDLLITDVVMPGMNGPELASRLTLMRPGLIVLYMSGYTDHALLHGGMIEAGTAFLQKPFLPETLVMKVDELLQMAGEAHA